MGGLMASKISALTTMTDSQISRSADFVAIVDTDATTTKKTLVQDIVAAGLGSVSAAGTPASFSATHYVTVSIGGVTHYIPAALAAW